MARLESLTTLVCCPLAVFNLEAHDSNNCSHSIIGSQALKALKEAGVASVLINPNIATIQTNHSLADEVYYLPVTPEYVSYVIEREKPDGIFLSFGGQTALNLGVQMQRLGLFEKYGVKVLGTSVKTLETSEDRDLFARALDEIDIPIAKSIAVGTIDEALDAAEKVGYPIIVRAAGRTERCIHQQRRDGGQS